MTSIEWTQTTWNPVTGCDRVSDGCTNCYALTMAARLKGMGSAKYQRDGTPPTSGPGFGVTCHPDTLTQPLRWQSPRKVFVNSMSDLFHGDVPDEFIGSVFEAMAATPRHTYQILTKRPGRMRSLLSKWGRQAAQETWAGPGTAIFRRHDQHWVGPIAWPLPNVWLGVSVENQQWADVRVPALLDTPASIRFLSAEPLLGPVDLSEWLCCLHPSLIGDEGPVAELGRRPRRWRCHACDSVVDDHAGLVQPGIGWVIAGGESGLGARPMHPDWARSLRDQCTEAGVPFFFKQWGTWQPVDCDESLRGCRWVSQWSQDDHPDRYRPGAPLHRMGFAHMHRAHKKTSGRVLDGRAWDQVPATQKDVCPAYDTNGGGSAGVA